SITTNQHVLLATNISPPLDSSTSSTSEYKRLIEYNQHYYFYQYQNDNNEIKSMLHSTHAQYDLRQQQTEVLKYDVENFQRLPIPILWQDHNQQIHWNRAAEQMTYELLEQRQFPSSITLSNAEKICHKRQLTIAHQWASGFFSRFHQFVELFLQGLSSDRMIVLEHGRMNIGNSGDDDYLYEGILRYFQPISICSQNLPEINYETDTLEWTNLEDCKRNFKYFYLTTNSYFKWDYAHAPIRKQLFDFNRIISRQITSKKWYSTSNIYNHAFENIYVHHSFKNSSLAMRSKIFKRFIFLMINLYIFRPVPRIQLLANQLHEYWSQMLADKYENRQISSQTVLLHSAALYVRRGEKAPEDEFYLKYGQYRNVLLYLLRLKQEELKQQKTFSSIFVLTDDADVMKQCLEFSNNNYFPSNNSDKNAVIGHQILNGRDITYNVYAPQKCFDPYRRIGFETFLASLIYLLRTSEHVVGHESSNVSRFIQEYLYATRQLNQSITEQSVHSNALDSYDV
ncbi:unnamed protein product, partial [Didymodactylos carnosus]